MLVKVNYQRDSHNAIFNPDNGEENINISVKYEASITRPNKNPEKQGYIFDSWKGYSSDAKMGLKDISYKAKWNPAEGTSYTVKHIREDLNGGYSGNENLIENEGKQGITEAQTQEQAKSYEGFTPLEIKQAEILADGTAVVEVKYSRNSYSVNWISEDLNYKTEQVKYNDLIKKPTSNPTKQGFVFEYWEGLGSGATMGIIEQNFTAAWTPASDTKYRVKHIREDLNGDYSLNEFEEKKGTTRTQTAASPKAYPGFTANLNYDQVEIQADGTSIVTINYDRNSYAISWIANGEIYETTEAIKYGEKITIPNVNPDNKIGYTFDGWSNVPVTMPWEDISYEANWKAKRYIVTLDVNGGDELSENAMEVTYDSKYRNLPNPGYTGYRFANWTDENGATVTASKIVKIPYDHELTANWAAETDVAYTVEHYQENVNGDNYTLKEKTEHLGETDTETVAVANSYEGFTAQNFSQKNIDGDGSSVVRINYNRNEHTVTWNIDGIESKVSYRYGENIERPDTTREGYNFKAWNINVASTMPDEDLNYTATWTPKQYTVSFNGNGGSSPDSIKVTYDSTYLGLPSPSRTGYDFKGWFTSSSGGIQIDLNTQVEITSDQTLYAQWEPKEYEVEFDLNGGTGTIPEGISVTYDNKYGDLPENSGSKTGYSFKGWYTAASGGDKITSSFTVSTPNNHTLHAQWQANNYNVIFEANSGSGTMKIQSHTYDQSKALTANAFTKTGHSFSEWNTTSDGSGIRYTNTESITNLVTEGSIRLYAQWKINKYKISFNSNGGSDVEAIVQDFATTITAPTDPSREGYKFDSWEHNGKKYSFTNMPGENIELIGKWNPVEYDINYVLNGGQNQADNPLKYNIDSGNLALSDTSGKKGYTFEGWYRDTELTNKVEGIAITGGSTGEKTFYANWRANSYKVTFHKNTGDGTESIDQTFTYDDIAKPLNTNTFTRQGYTFDGWNTESKGTGTNYSDNQEVRNLAESGTVNLHAKWKLVEYKITYHLNEGSQGSGNPEIYTVETTGINLKNPSRDRYIFTGWYDNPGFTGEKITQIEAGATGDINLHASWRAKDNIEGIGQSAQTVTFDGTAKMFEIIGTNIKDFTVEYKKSGESQWSDKAIHAGKYAVRITRATDDNYNDYELIIENALEIKRASRTMVPPKSAKSYGSTILVDELTDFTGYGNGDVEYAVSKTATIPTSGWTTSLSVGGLYSPGNYYLFARVTEGGNFLAATSIASTFTVPVYQINTKFGDWQIGVKTDNNGTDSKVEVRFRYIDGIYSDKHNMDSDEDDHEKWDKRTYPAPESKGPWMVSGFDIFHDGTGYAAGWKCQYIDLQIGNSGTYRIDVNKFFDKSSAYYSVSGLKRNITSTGQFNSWGGSYNLTNDHSGFIDYNFNGNITDQYGTYNAHAYSDAPVFEVITSTLGYTDCFSYNVNSFKANKTKLYNKMVENNETKLTFTIKLKFDPRSTNNTNNGIFTKIVTITR